MKAVRRLAPLLVIAAIIAIFFLSGAGRYFTLDSLRSHQQALESLVRDHPIESLALYILAYATVCALCLPLNLVTTLAGGLMFGAWVGGGATVIAGTVGSLGAYFAAHTALGRPLLRMAEKRGGGLEKAMKGFGKNAFAYVLSMRLVPVFPFWMVSLAAGVASPPVWAFVLGTGLGIIPASFIYAGLGSGLGKTFASGEPVHLSVIFAPHILLPLLGLAALSLTPIVVTRLRKRP
jgi:uncharacterized membrane protein YdjX (TVP38/TMEM64 family)